MYIDKTNMEHKMYDHTGNNSSQRNSNKRFKEEFGNRTRKAYTILATTDGYSWNITHNTESSAF
jgi:hypothetical protein